MTVRSKARLNGSSVESNSGQTTEVNSAVPGSGLQHEPRENEDNRTASSKYSSKGFYNNESDKEVRPP